MDVGTKRFFHLIVFITKCQHIGTWKIAQNKGRMSNQHDIYSLYIFKIQIL